MARYSIDETTLTAIGDAVRGKVGETEYRDVSYTSKTYHLDTDIHNSENRLLIPVCGATQMKLNKLASTGGDMTLYLLYCDHEVDEGSTNLFGTGTDKCTMSNFTNTNIAMYSLLTGYTYDFEITWYDADGNQMEVAISEEVPKTMTPERMATEINGLQVMKSSLLNITGNMDYMFYAGHWDDFIETYGDKITTSDITDVSRAFAYSTMERIPFEINCRPTTAMKAGNCCNYAANLLEPPVFKNMKIDDMQYMFKSCKNIRYFPEDYGEDWDWSYMTSATSGYYGYKNGLFDSCYSLRKLPMALYKYGNPYLNYTYSPLREFRDMYSLDEVVDMPFPCDTAFSGTSYSSPFYNSFTGLYRCKEFTFAPDIGVKKWAKQVLDFSKLGYGYPRTEFYNSGITADKEIKDSTTYAALKDDPDWYTLDANYSRYNHDSAVATINSLPDCSAYQASSGMGANTIKFKGAAGSATDGGAINTLTEEEIAVAAAKGWTVAFA